MLQFQIINANPSITTSQIQWYFNNTLAIKYRTTLFGAVLVFSSDLKSLTISNINYNIAGKISITAQNIVGSDSDYIDIIVEGTYVCMYVRTYVHYYFKGKNY